MTHTLGRIPLDERSARHRELYLTTRNNHNRQISIHPVGFKPAIPASKRPQTYALNCVATGIGSGYLVPLNFVCRKNIWCLPVAVRSKAWVFGRSLARIVGSNPTGSMDVCLL